MTYRYVEFNSAEYADLLKAGWIFRGLIHIAGQRLARMVR